LANALDGVKCHRPIPATNEGIWKKGFCSWMKKWKGRKGEREKDRQGTEAKWSHD